MGITSDIFCRILVLSVMVKRNGKLGEDITVVSGLGKVVCLRCFCYQDMDDTEGIRSIGNHSYNVVCCANVLYLKPITVYLVFKDLLIRQNGIFVIMDLGLNQVSLFVSLLFNAMLMPC